MGVSTYLNLALHRLVESYSESADPYTLEVDFVTELLRAISRVAAPRWSGVRVYFDDNHRSCFELAERIVSSYGFDMVVAVPTDTVGTSGHCSMSDLRLLASHGVSIVPHGCSHSALAVYRGSTLVRTPIDGTYRNSAKGRTAILSEEEVIYQLRESLGVLREFHPMEFVLPYGLYNDDTLRINHELGIYEILTTCEAFLDTGAFLRPRLLVTRESTPSQIFDTICALPMELSRFRSNGA